MFVTAVFIFLDFPIFLHFFGDFVGARFLAFCFVFFFSMILRPEFVSLRIWRFCTQKKQKAEKRSPSLFL